MCNSVFVCLSACFCPSVDVDVNVSVHNASRQSNDNFVVYVQPEDSLML